MSDDATMKIGLEADADSAIRDMKAAATAAASLADSFREIASVAVNAARALNKVEQGVTGTGRAARGAAAGIKAQAEAVKELSKLEQYRAGLSGRTVASGYERIRVEADAARKAVQALNLVQKPSGKMYNEQDKRWANKAEVSAYAEALERVAKAEQQLATIRARRGQTMQPARPVGYNTYEAQQAAKATAEFGKAAADAAAQVDTLHNGLFTARFALNDISIGTGIAGAALLAFNAATIKAAADYESAMASIDRTTGATASQMAIIRDQFVDLAQSVPAGFDNIAQIGELAGQLNIPTRNIASFTETVAQFTSSTDVAVQQSAEAFGRLDALLPDVQGNYEALGSSILNVGVNSVATESAIISTTTQIAAAGAQAQFTADEVIGLAASYASLGIAPEAARGSTIRIFSEIREAASAGGASLEEFARIAGMSASEFQSAWANGDASDLFIEFLRGLQTEGTNAETVLRNLGITGVRDINALLRLSQNVDIVTQSFGYANAGFTEATQLSEAFGITSETLNSRLEILGQSFQALFAELGATGVGPIKEFVNLLIDMLRVFTDMAKNPVAQWITIFGGLLTLLAGGVLVLTSVVTRIGAMSVAVKILQFDMARWRAEMVATNTQLTAMQAGLLKAGTAVTSFSAIMKGLAWSTAITAGITLATAGFIAIKDAMKSAGDKARDAFGDLSGLTSALQADTKVYEETGEKIGSIEGSLTTVREKSADWVVAIEEATGAQTTLGSEMDHTSTSVRDQTYAIGENTAAWLANQLANNEAIKSLFELNSKIANGEALGGGIPLPLEGVISAAVRNDVDAADKIIEQFRLDSIEAFRADGSLFSEDESLLLEDRLTKLRNVIDLVSGSLGEASAAGTINRAVNEALGVTTGDTSLSVGELSDEAGSASSKLNELRSAIENVFAPMLNLGQFAEDARTLFAGIADAGTSFNVLSEAGQSNLDNLISAISTTIAAGEALGVSAVDSVGALFLQLQSMGVDTANLLSSLASIPGIGVSGVEQIQGYLDGTKQMSSSNSVLTQTFDAIADSAPKASKGISNAGSSAGRAAQQVRTLVDYSNDLEAVFRRAFDIRFGSQQGTDTITLAFSKMREAIDKANDSIEDAQRTIAGLMVDNSTLQYFLGVAQDYGDAIRAAEIQQEIAENNAKIADEQEKAADAGKVLNKNLVGQTDIAAENRGEILGLVTNYQSLIAAYASSGLNQQQLAAKVAQLRAQFLSQAQALGYSGSQLAIYAKAFDDMSLAISRVPRNITVTANVNPAIQALNELEAKGRTTAANIGRSIGNSIGGSIGGGGIFDALNAAQERAARIAQLNALVQYNSRQAILIPSAAQQYLAFAETFKKQLVALRGYADGGFTGTGGRNQVRGLVHGNEFVVNAENTSRLGLPFLNALNNGQTPVASPGIMVVELSARDRALLAQAGNVSLSIDGRQIANATNSANFVSAQRGRN